MSTAFSIRDTLHRYAAGLPRQFSTDRLATVGASDVGQCLRKTAFGKSAVPPDKDYRDRYGARLRGDLIERAYWEPGLRAALPEGAQLLYAGADQVTLFDGYLSATPDGLLVGLARDVLLHLGIPDIGDSLVVECKSIDPRANLDVEKTEHSFQAQVQLGIIRRVTEYRPQYALVSYTDASFLDEVTEFPIAYSESAYQAAAARARLVMTTDDPLDLPAEGKLAGGGECKWCPWARHCAAITVAGIPRNDSPRLGANAEAELKELRDHERRLDAQKGAAGKAHAQACEDIKGFLRTHEVRGHKGDGWSVEWAPVKGRVTVDTKAAEAAGLDLSPYHKTGNPSDRLTVK